MRSICLAFAPKFTLSFESAPEVEKVQYRTMGGDTAEITELLAAARAGDRVAAADRAAGLEVWIAASPAEYLRIASRRAADRRRWRNYARRCGSG